LEIYFKVPSMIFFLHWTIAKLSKELELNKAEDTFGSGQAIGALASALRTKGRTAYCGQSKDDRGKAKGITNSQPLHAYNNPEAQQTGKGHQNFLMSQTDRIGFAPTIPPGS
jgi:hypothetical protein